MGHSTFSRIVLHTSLKSGGKVRPYMISDANVSPITNALVGNALSKEHTKGVLCVGSLTEALVAHAKRKGLSVNITDVPVYNPLSGGILAYDGNGTAEVFGAWSEDSRVSALVAHELGHFLLARRTGCAEKRNYGLADMGKQDANVIESVVGHYQLREYNEALGWEATLRAFEGWRCLKDIRVDGDVAR